MTRRNFTDAERDAALADLQSGDPARHKCGIAQLCKIFDPLVKASAIAYQQHVSGAEREELEQVARVGLLEACVSYAPPEKDRGGLFATHAHWCVRNALSKYVESLVNPVSLAAWLVRRLPKMRKMTTRLAQQLLREPTIEELAEAMNMKTTAIAVMLAYDEGPQQYTEG